jgi:GT2 family glycosyltransferase
MDLSIIIVNWNTRDWLLKCIASLYKALGQWKSEIIVVDNASQDDSVKAVSGKYPGVQIIQNEQNLGFSKANNRGIRRASGRYIALVNSDALVREETFDRMIPYMDAHPGIGLIGPKVLNPDSSLQLQSRPRHFPTLWRLLCQATGLNASYSSLLYYSAGSTKEVDILGGCFWLLRKETLDAVGLLDERFFIYAEDVDWCRRLSHTRWKALYYPVAEILHYAGASSDKAPVRFFLEMYRSNLIYWEKHYGRPGQLAYWVIMMLNRTLRVLTGGIPFLLGLERKKRESAARRDVICLRWLLQVMPLFPSSRGKLLQKIDLSGKKGKPAEENKKR